MPTRARPRAAPPRPPNDLERSLSPTATLSEVIHGLLSLGLRVEELAALTGNSESSVQKWMQGRQQPRRAHLLIDELRAITLTMLRGGLEPERITSWLRARQLVGEPFPRRRPIEVIAEDPLAVMSASETLVPIELLPREPTTVMAASERLLIEAGKGLGSESDPHRGELADL